MDVGLREDLCRALEAERLYGLDHLAPAGPTEIWLTVVARPEEFQGPCGELLERMIAALRLPPGRVRRARPGEESSCGPTRVLLYLVGETEAPPGAGPLSSASTTPVVATSAPSRLLQRPDLKPQAWSDLKRVMEILGLPIP